jgi:DNA polymerase phi
MLQSMLQLQQPEVAQELIEEVDICAGKLTTKILKKVAPKSAKKKKQAEEEEVVADEDLDPVEVLVDILLSLLVNGSSLIREVANRVFAAFTGRVSMGAMTTLLEVLSRKEDKKGKEVRNRCLTLSALFLASILCHLPSASIHSVT